MCDSDQQPETDEDECSDLKAAFKKFRVDTEPSSGRLRKRAGNPFAADLELVLPTSSATANNQSPVMAVNSLKTIKSKCVSPKRKNIVYAARLKLLSNRETRCSVKSQQAKSSKASSLECSEKVFGEEHLTGRLDDFAKLSLRGADVAPDPTEGITTDLTDMSFSISSREHRQSLADDAGTSTLAARFQRDDDFKRMYRSTSTCSQQARIDDITMDELASYFENYVHIPRKMSTMAEMMYT